MNVRIHSLAGLRYQHNPAQNRLTMLTLNGEQLTELRIRPEQHNQAALAYKACEAALQRPARNTTGTPQKTGLYNPHTGEISVEQQTYRRDQPTKLSPNGADGVVDGDQLNVTDADGNQQTFTAATPNLATICGTG